MHSKGLHWDINMVSQANGSESSPVLYEVHQVCSAQRSTDISKVRTATCLEWALLNLPAEEVKD